MMKKLWMDDSGAIISAELVLLLTLLLGAVAVGGSALRVAVATELADSGAEVAAINQSFTVGGLAGHHAAASPQAYTDLLDSCDDGCTQANENGEASRCLTICVSDQRHEEGIAPTPTP